MQKYLPSKQFVKTISLALLAALIVFIVGKILNKKVVWENSGSDANVVLAEDSDFFSQDKDEDGLYDWEEALWGTNPDVKDTDGDGVDDKKFVENKRKDVDIDETYKPDSDNETEVFAKQFFTTAAVLDQSGSFNQDTVEQFSQGVGQSINNFSLKDKYTLSNLKLTGVSVQEYHKKMSEIYARLKKPEVNELTLLAYIMENPEDEDALNDLGVNLAYLDGLIKGLINTEVPHGNAGLHLSYINNLDKISEIMKSIIYVEEDPLKVVTYLSKFDEYSDKLLNDIESFRNYFISNGII